MRTLSGSASQAGSAPSIGNGTVELADEQLEHVAGGGGALGGVIGSVMRSPIPDPDGGKGGVVGNERLIGSGLPRGRRLAGRLLLASPHWFGLRLRHAALGTLGVALLGLVPDETLAHRSSEQHRWQLWARSELRPPCNIIVGFMEETPPHRLGYAAGQAGPAIRMPGFK